MDNRLEQDALVEDALKSQPLAPMPRSISANVMSRIQVEKRPTLITWNDFAIALVIALTIGAIFITIQNLPPVAVAKLRIQGILLYQDFIINANWLIPSFFFGSATLLAGFTVLFSVQMPFMRRK